VLKIPNAKTVYKQTNWYAISTGLFVYLLVFNFRKGIASKSTKTRMKKTLSEISYSDKMKLPMSDRLGVLKSFSMKIHASTKVFDRKNTHKKLTIWNVANILSGLGTEKCFKKESWQ